MDLKRYKKTRYQNIFKSINNGNYIITISKPKTTISFDQKGNKIFDISTALDIRNSKSTKIIKTQQIKTKDSFQTVWEKYMDAMSNLSFNSLKKKRIFYNKYFKYYFGDMKLSKITKEDISDFLKFADTTNKEKNALLMQLKIFFNWCIKNDILLYSPARYTEKLKEEKKDIRYWLPEHIKKMVDVLNDDILIGDLQTKHIAYIIKMVVLIGFSLGDRIGETRALRFKDISKEFNIISINHSIDYDPSTKNFLKETKNQNSKRKVDVSPKLLYEIEKYRIFLENELNMTVTDNTLVLVNPINYKPYSDTYLRKWYNYYIEKAKVPKICMKDLRHTFVTTMMSEGWEMYAISKRVGHSDIKTTINTYGNISEAVKKQMAVSTDKYY